MSDPQYRPRKTIEDICTIPGTKIPSVPPIPPDQVPNLESIRKAYNVAFAPGLDRLLESGHSRWFLNDAFDLLASDRVQLGHLLSYLTLVSNNNDGVVGSSPTLVSQEARVTWAMLELCVRPEHDSCEEADKLARRCRALGALLTGESVTSPTTSIADFVVQDEPEPDSKSTAFEKQLARRSDEFWNAVEMAAASQGQNGHQGVSPQALAKVNQLLDGIESRDIIYSIMLLGQGTSGNGSGEPSSERELAKRYLEQQASGRATNQVFATVSGMALRAFDI